MKFEAAVIEKFNRGPEIREFDISPLGEGEILVRIEAAGVCGSDLHIFEGRDPRIRLPMIPGHEGAGIVADMKGDVLDVRGNPVHPGDRIIWDRGVVCGRCFYCSVEKKPFLCINRKVYGITFSTADSPFPNGCYSRYIKLSSLTRIVKAGADIAPEVLVPVGCSGATSFHAVEESGLREGETVVIQGPGPLGIFAAAFCRNRGAGHIIMTGSGKSRKRMELARSFGVTHLVYRDEMALESQLEFIKSLTGGRGADIVFEMAGSAGAVESGQHFLARGGRYMITGIAVPVGSVGIDVYENLVRKNASVRGVWVSDTSHLLKALEAVEDLRYPFEKLVSRRFSLVEAGQAIESVKDRDVLKSVIMP